MSDTADYSGKATDWIREHYREKYNADKLAAALFINKDYLGRCFKKETGDTLLHFHHKVRCEQAKILLEKEGCSIGMVSNQVGYATTSHFIKVFKSINGETPLAYRARKLNKADNSVYKKKSRRI